MLAQTRDRAVSYVRTALHTRSLAAAWDLCVAPAGVSEVRLPGFAGTFRFRRGTTDAQFLRGLANGDSPPEYELPPGLTPLVILDIGANIGAVSAELARRWPAARIYAFEPLPENVALLRHNVAQFTNVTVAPYGLGAQTGEFTYERSDDPSNFGGGGFCGGAATGVGWASSPATMTQQLRIVAVPEALATLGITTVDVIKIDTEGAERDILMSFPPDVLAGAQAVVGELHRGPRDGELLDYLRQWFTLDVHINPRSGRPHYFRALRAQ